MKRATLTLAVLAALGGVARADPPPSPDPALAYYPAAAKAAAIEGSATLTCTRNAHMALKGCVLTSETPAGQGFGQAALVLAARSPDNPRLDVHNPHLVGPQSLTVAFSLHPPSVDPDLSQMAHLITNPSILAAPTAADIWSTYPGPAYRGLVNGHVTLKCGVSRVGLLTACDVTEETPRGQEFAVAAKLIARQYRLSPMKRDGEAIDGQVQVPVDFDAVAAALAGLEQSDASPGADLATPPRRWLRVPTGYDIEHVYPDRAMHGYVWGHAVLRCTVAKDGALQGCAVASQAPADWGFGAAALELAPTFRLDVTPPLGDPAAVGAVITVSVGFDIAERCSNCPTPVRNLSASE